jgi:hypothetical protein
MSPWVSVCQCTKCGVRSNGINGVEGWWELTVGAGEVRVKRLRADYAVVRSASSAETPTQLKVLHACGMECGLSLAQTAMAALGS